MIREDLAPLPAIPSEFAAGTVETPFGTAVSNLFSSYENGVPRSFSTPIIKGGKYLRREDLNQLGRLGTRLLYRALCGGVVEYDPVWQAEIGGYPEGAVVRQFDGEKSMAEYVSLADDNTDALDDENSWTRLRGDLPCGSIAEGDEDHLVSSGILYEALSDRSPGEWETGTGYASRRAGTLVEAYVYGTSFNKTDGAFKVPFPFAPTVDVCLQVRLESGADKGIGVIQVPANGTEGTLVASFPDSLLGKSSLAIVGQTVYTSTVDAPARPQCTVTFSGANNPSTKGLVYRRTTPIGETVSLNELGGNIFTSLYGAPRIGWATSTSPDANPVSDSFTPTEPTKTLYPLFRGFEKSFIGKHIHCDYVYGSSSPSNATPFTLPLSASDIAPGFCAAKVGVRIQLRYHTEAKSDGCELYSNDNPSSPVKLHEIGALPAKRTIGDYISPWFNVSRDNGAYPVKLKAVSKGGGKVNVHCWIIGLKNAT